MNPAASKPHGDRDVPASMHADAQFIFHDFGKRAAGAIVASSNPAAALGIALEQVGVMLAELAPQVSPAGPRTAGMSAVALSPVMQASGADAERLFGQLISLSDQVEGYSAYVSSEISQDGMWALGGSRDCSGHLSSRHKISRARATRLLDLGHALRNSLPKTLTQLCSGDIRSEHAAIMAKEAPSSDLRRQALRQPAPVEPEFARPDRAAPTSPPTVDQPSVASPGPADSPSTAGPVAAALPSEGSSPAAVPAQAQATGAAFGLQPGHTGLTGEDQLLNQASQLTPAEFGGEVQRWGHRTDPYADEQRHTASKNQEFLRIYRRDGGYKIVMFLSNEDGQIATAALHSMAAELTRSRRRARRSARRSATNRPLDEAQGSHRAQPAPGQTPDPAQAQGGLFALDPDSHQTSAADASPATRDADAANQSSDTSRTASALADPIDQSDSTDRRPMAARLAEAFVALARVNLEQVLNSTTANSRPHMSVIVDYGTLTAIATRTGTRIPPEAAANPAIWGDNAGPLPPSVLQRLACDGEISRVVFGPAGQIINAGQTIRTASPPQRRAVIARDRHCVYPGCAAPPGLCEVHHVEEWIRDGGPTDVDNLALTCWHHHHLIHARGQRLLRIGTRWILESAHRSLPAAG